MSLHTIIYSSRENSSFSDSEKSELLDSARDFNSSKDISGMLLYFDRVFFQVLEGPRDQIHQLYDKIQKDSRHQSVTTHVDEPLEQRLFSEWSMAFKSTDGSSVKNQEIMSDIIEFDKGCSAEGQKQRLTSLIGTVARSLLH